MLKAAVYCTHLIIENFLETFLARVSVKIWMWPWTIISALMNVRLRGILTSANCTRPAIELKQRQ